MVQLKYKGQNPLIFGKISIKNGLNEINEEEFYNLMLHPSFVSRLQTRTFTVPKGLISDKASEVSEPEESKGDPKSKSKKSSKSE